MPSSRDIVVVGAGVVGCAIAYELARRGASVEIIDDRGPGRGATHASAGMLAPFNEAPDGGPLLDLAARGLALFDDFVARLGEDTGAPLNYGRHGTLDVALDDAGRARLGALHAILASTGIAATEIDAADLRRLEPSLRPVAGALMIPAQGFVGVADLTRAMVTAARKCGASIIEHRRVKRIATTAGELSVVTDRGAIAADLVVLAAGSWSGQIDVDGREALLPVSPIRGQLLELRWNAPPLSHVVWSDRCYLVPWSDGTVLVGATVEHVGFDERTTVDGVRGLLDAVRELLPSSADATFVGARAGLRPAAPDHLPIVGPSAGCPQLIYATAHYRNGVLLAPLTARLVADLILDERVDPLLDVMSPARFGGL